MRVHSLHGDTDRPDAHRDYARGTWPASLQVDAVVRAWAYLGQCVGSFHFVSVGSARPSLSKRLQLESDPRISSSKRWSRWRLNAGLRSLQRRISCTGFLCCCSIRLRLLSPFKRPTLLRGGNDPFHALFTDSPLRWFRSSRRYCLGLSLDSGPSLLLG
jgi:hypothetical protein